MNPRFPVVFEGSCRNYKNTKATIRDGVLVSDYIIAMPKVDFEVAIGDTITLTDTVRTISGKVIDFIVNNLGTNIWWNKVNN